MFNNHAIQFAAEGSTFTRRSLLRLASQAAAIAAGSALLAGCGGGGGGGSQGGGNTGGETGAGNPGDPVSPEQRVAALTAVKGEYERLCNGKINCSSRAVADFMLGMNQFERVGIMPDGCVWGRFTDGQHYVVGNNLKEGVGGPKPPGLAPSAKAFAEEIPESGIPNSANAYSLSSFTNFAYPDGSEGEMSLYEDFIRRAGYEIPERERPYLETLKSLPELGFFNWITHGGTLNQDGSLTHALMTITETVLEDILVHAVDLQSGNLVYYLGQYGYLRGKWQADNFFAITPQFIKSYNWKFSENSIVLIHACASDNASFRAAFKQAGAALYGGWSKPVWVHQAGDAMSWLLNYFVASNVPVPTPDPRNRAYDYKIIKEYCDENEVTVYNDPTEGGLVAFNFTKFRGEPGGISPSLTDVIVQEHLEQVILRGSFGKVQGKVFIGTAIFTDPNGADNFLPWRPDGTVTELEVVEWSAGEVTAKIPPTGPGSAGFIAVKVGKRWGNTRAISRWTGKLTVVGKGFGTLALHEELFFTFRADVGYKRNGPGKPLESNLEPYIATPFEAPSYWKWRAEGENSATFPGPSTVKVEWSGAGQINLPKEPEPGAQEFYTVTGVVNRKEDEVRLLISGGKFAALKVKMVITDPNGSQTLNNNHPIMLPSTLARIEGQVFGIKLNLNEDLSIAAGELTSIEPTVTPMAGDNPKFNYTIAWEKMEPEYKPHSKGGI